MSISDTFNITISSASEPNYNALSGLHNVTLALAENLECLEFFQSQTLTEKETQRKPN